MNVGFLEASKQYPYDCFIFHDVDLIPEDDRNLYTCPEQPRHMSVAIDKFRYRYFFLFDDFHIKWINQYFPYLSLFLQSIEKITL